MKSIYKIAQKTLIGLLFVSLLLVLPLNTLAAPKSNTDIEKQRLDNLKERADREIERRVSSLNKLVVKISLITRITNEQKSAFTSEITKNISELTALKTKIAADTDLTVLKANVKSIVDSYKIYGIFVPKINLLAAANRTDQARIKLLDVASKLEASIKTMKDSGKDVAKLETDLADMKTNLEDAKTQINSLQEKIINVTSADYPGNKGILLDGKNSMALIRKNLANARQDAGKIVDAIKLMNQEPNTGTDANK